MKIGYKELEIMEKYILDQYNWTSKKVWPTGRVEAVKYIDGVTELQMEFIIEGINFNGATASDTVTLSLRDVKNGYELGMPFEEEDD